MIEFSKIKRHVVEFFNSLRYYHKHSVIAAVAMFAAILLSCLPVLSDGPSLFAGLVAGWTVYITHEAEQYFIDKLPMDWKGLLWPLGTTLALYIFFRLVF